MRRREFSYKLTRNEKSGVRMRKYLENFAVNTHPHARFRISETAFRKSRYFRSICTRLPHFRRVHTRLASIVTVLVSVGSPKNSKVKMNGRPSSLRPDAIEMPFTMAEKMIIMNDLLTNQPIFPKGNLYAADLLRRNPVSMKFALLWSDQADGIH